ncbi:2-amino-4-hydroxy-6-hydroxymethyldihydropteridine diphosphokinase [Aquabacterium sp. OR-4]|uniref:2-amino-4-hydroxy-6- hydroxymethyldihydropteridine diphosphokinase n=1 Tax=Aquabacterium sp. OR-4 TaxID=2978127 RepID=UPI0021B2EB8A|nr:2-amino-4-hydroxy-6-hydroxymethyldihydropteridine diphosphokinase [Aquabacterium sp. OR-4]MDT7835788.1 2-amino-4-hydroxy-6-hydroxymethyldihydropteridine diphosphokinase [Aquabacterium sp. OR-4]
MATGEALVGLGANLGDAPATLQAALDALAALPGCRVRACSALYRSAPVDADGPDFYNAVAWLDGVPPPEALLAALHAIEHQHGRARPYLNAPRTLDLDLLLHGPLQRSSPALWLPHPRLHLRAFVLRPLLELRPALCVPGLGALADHLPAVAAQRIERLPADGAIGLRV